MNKLPIVFKLEKEIFYLFSFLNSAGYDEENNPRGMHPLRKSIRRRLKNTLKINHYSSLKYLLSKKHQGQFVMWLLWKKYGARESFNAFLKQDLAFFRKFGRLFQRFVDAEEKNLLWSEAKKIYSKDKKNRYKKIVKELNSLMKVLNVDFSILNLNKINIIPNFLDAYNRGYGPKIGKTAFIIYGPLKNGNFGLIRHEFLHSVVNPLIVNNNIFVKKTEKFLKCRSISTRFKKIGYSNWPVIIEEHLVRAIDIKTRRLKFKEKRNLLKREKGKGFACIEKIYTKLRKDYKKNEFLDILNNIIDNIDKFVL